DGAGGSADRPARGHRSGGGSVTGPDGPVGVLTIDGANGVGKTAVARELALRLGWRWLSVGTVYRALAAADTNPDSEPGPEVEIVEDRAGDGGRDPVVRLGDRRFTEPELAGERLAGLAAAIGQRPAWRRWVSAAVAGYAGTGLVVEGRSTHETFPDAA